MVRIQCFIFVIMIEAKARVDAMWEQMNKGVPKNALRQISSNKNSATSKSSPKSSNVRILVGPSLLCG